MGRPTSTAPAPRPVARHGGRAYPDLAAVLVDEAVETVVNLTVPQAHFEVAAAARGGQARPQREAARTPPRRRGPSGRAGARARRPPLERSSTLLGEAQQTLWKHVREGAIGTSASRLRRGELGPDRALASGSAQPLRGGAPRRRRRLSAHDPDGDVRPRRARPGSTRRRSRRAVLLRRDALPRRGAPDWPSRCSSTSRWWSRA